MSAYATLAKDRERAREHLAAKRSSKQAVEDPDSPAAHWRAGEFAYKLQSHQRATYAAILAWCAAPPRVEGALYDSVYVLDHARRWGKSALCLLLEYSWAIDLPKLIGRPAILTYATREKDQIKRIVLQINRWLSVDAPTTHRPRYYDNHAGTGEGLYFPESCGGSIIKLVGVDKDPDRLRGEGSDGGVFSEAGYMKNLEDNVCGPFLPQFQQRPWARLILESSAPTELDHDFDRVFVPDAKMRRAYSFATLDDNTALTDEDREKAFREVGGKDSIRAQREYYGRRLRDPESAAIPEFDLGFHVGVVERPAYAHAFVFQDPGSSDLYGLVFAYWHFELRMLVCERSWAKRNAGTGEVADVIKSTCAELWEAEAVRRHDLASGDAAAVSRATNLIPPTAISPLRYWDGPIERKNPALNVSDVAPMMVTDMRVDHGLRVVQADKSHRRHGVDEAKFYKLRNAFRERVQDDDGIVRPRILILPDSGPLAEHCQHARWNEQRSDLVRHKVYGHFDACFALMYGWRSVQPWLDRCPDKSLVAKRSEVVVVGPNYRAPASRAQKFHAAVTGRDPSTGAKLPRPARGSGFGVCSICKMRKMRDFFRDGQFYCSEECADAWTYRASGGVKPAGPTGEGVDAALDDGDDWDGAAE